MPEVEQREDVFTALAAAAAWIAATTNPANAEASQALQERLLGVADFLEKVCEKVCTAEG